MVAAGGEILKVCAEVGGSISGEHGIGLEKADYMPLIFSEADLECMSGSGAPSTRPGSAIPARSSRAARPAPRPAGLSPASHRREGPRPALLARGRGGSLSWIPISRDGWPPSSASATCSPAWSARRMSLEGRTPEAVVFPGTREEVAALLVLAGGGRAAGHAVGRRYPHVGGHAAGARPASCSA